MIYGILPPTFICQITFENDLGWSQFDPKLSPSQMFQCLYNCYCSLYNTKYSHSVTQFVHTLITTEDCIADFSRMPLHEIDGTYSTSIELKPILMALKYLPTIFGIQMKDVGRPDFLYAIADVIKDSPMIRLISVESCNVSQGISEFAYALAHNKNLHLEYLDISDNPFENLSPLCAALASNKGDLWYLDFSNCGMTNYDVNVAMTSLITNDNLWGIIHLDFRGAIVKEDSAQLICKYLSKVGRHDSTTLRFLSFGAIQSHLADVLYTLNKYPQPIESLFLNGSKFDLAAVNQLGKLMCLAPYLRELDLSETNLKPENIAGLIRAVPQNGAIRCLTLRLNSLNLNGKRLDTVLRAFVETSNFCWQTLSFDDNNLTPKDVRKIVDVLRRMPILTGLSISGNLGKSSQSVDCVEYALDQLPFIRQLWVRGNSSKYIGRNLLRVFRKVYERGLTLFDCSYNHIKDEGIEELKKVVYNNNNLVELHIDGSHPRDYKKLFGFIDIASQSNTLRRLKFPLDDVNYIIRKYITKKHRSSFFRDVSYKQRLLQDRLLMNETRIGLHSDLSEQFIPELDDMLDEMTIQCHTRLSRFNTHIHSGAPLSYGLPFPYLSIDDNQYQDTQRYNQTREIEEYEIPECATVCEEPVTDTYCMHVRSMSIRTGTDFLINDKNKNNAQQPTNSMAPSNQAHDDKHHKHHKHRDKDSDSSSDSSSESDSDSENYLGNQANEYYLG